MSVSSQRPLLSLHAASLSGKSSPPHSTDLASEPTHAPSALPESIFKKRKSRSCDDLQPVTPDKRETEPVTRGPKAAKLLQAPPLELDDLPNDLLRSILSNLTDAADLCAARQVFRDEGEVLETKWHQLYLKQHGMSTHTNRAALAAGSWQELFKSKTLKIRETQQAAAPGELPWDEPCAYELQVAVQNLVPASAGTRGNGTSIIFLLDGSGSVTEDDFKTMTCFVRTAIDSIASTHPEARAGILQFSNDVRVEVAPRSLDTTAFAAHLSAMLRMNGGTNIATAIQRAGQLLKPFDAPSSASLELADADDTTDEDEIDSVMLPPPPPPLLEVTSRVLILLTDGRVDSYQAREAVSITERLADEQAGVSMHAFGVGRGVDKTELLHIVQACGGASDAESRYLGLRTLDENPW